MSKGMKARLEDCETYWEDDGLYQKQYDALRKLKLVPGTGKARTDHGELLRSIERIYHDHYNNGCCNASVLSENRKTLRKWAKRLEKHVPGVGAHVTTVTRIFGACGRSKWGRYITDGESFELCPALEHVTDAVILLVTSIVNEQEANATSRAAGCVGANALTPRTVAERERKEASILDFGAGHKAIHTENLREQGFESVTAWECGRNFDPDLHDMNALTRNYAVVFASNVLNVQSMWSDVVAVVSTLAFHTQRTGACYVNLPLEPRKGAWALAKGEKGSRARRHKERDLTALETLLRCFWGRVEQVGGTRLAPVFCCDQKFAETQSPFPLPPTSKEVS